MATSAAPAAHTAVPDVGLAPGTGHRGWPVAWMAWNVAFEAARTVQQSGPGTHVEQRGQSA